MCALSINSDQPGHMHSLIRVFVVCMKKSKHLSSSLSTSEQSGLDGLIFRRVWVHWIHTYFIGIMMHWVVYLSGTLFIFMICWLSAVFYKKKLLWKISFKYTIRLSTYHIKIRPDILSGLIWVQTVCQGYQQMTMEATSRQKLTFIPLFFSGYYQIYSGWIRFQSDGGWNVSISVVLECELLWSVFVYRVLCVVHKPFI